MSNTWEKIAHLIEVNYGTQVDWEERFFICPECREPIYEADWDDTDLYYVDGNDFLCPICESPIE